jgi:hypothetical protein
MIIEGKEGMDMILCVYEESGRGQEVGVGLHTGEVKSVWNS